MIGSLVPRVRLTCRSPVVLPDSETSMSDIDRDALREGPIPYLGWWLEGAPGEPTEPASYVWYASEDQGDSRWQIKVVSSKMGGTRLEQYEGAQAIGRCAARGKVFLGTWTDRAEYTIVLPLQRGRIDSPAIREAIVRALYRLYEAGFDENDCRFDMDGIAIDLETTRAMVERAAKFLLDSDYIEDYGTFGRDWSTGDFWLTTRGVAYVESLPSAKSSRPMTDSGTAIILFADIVDSTALTERLGDTAFREKARDLDGALRTIIRDHAGAPIEGKLLGDGVLATFTSAGRAIDAALVCARTGDDRGLPLHLGLHAGDVIHEKDNVYGGAVNIASRISGLSMPGEVLVSDIVRGLARTSTHVSFDERGEHVLKGVSDPVHLYAVGRLPRGGNDRLDPKVRASELKVRASEVKRIGGENDPGIMLTALVENTLNRPSFVTEFVVEMTQPFEAAAVNYEFRTPENRPIRALALTIPAHGISDPVVVMAFFDHPLSYSQGGRARVSASGVAGGIEEWTGLEFPPLSPDTKQT